MQASCIAKTTAHLCIAAILAYSFKANSNYQSTTHHCMLLAASPSLANTAILAAMQTCSQLTSNSWTLSLSLFFPGCLSTGPRRWPWTPIPRPSLWVESTNECDPQVQNKLWFFFLAPWTSCDAPGHVMTCDDLISIWTSCLSSLCDAPDLISTPE